MLYFNYIKAMAVTSWAKHYENVGTEMTDIIDE